MYDPGELYVDPILTNFSVGFRDQQLFGLELAPETRVSTQSGRYRVFDRSDWVMYRSRREPGTVANEVRGRKWSEDSFFAKEHSLQSPIYDEENQELNSQGGLANATFGGALAINPERDAVKLITRSILLEHEKKVSDTVRDPANYPVNHVATLAGAQKWSDYTYVTPGDPNSVVSNPILNLRVAVQRIHLDTGLWPTDMFMPWDATGIIEEHPRVVDRFKNWSLTIDEAWKRLLAIPEGENFTVHTIDSKINQADNIDAAEDIVSLWGQDVWIGIIDNSDGQDVFTFAKTFAQIYPDGTTRPSDRWYDNEIKTTKVRTSYKYDVKVVSGLAGYLFVNAVAAIT